MHLFRKGTSTKDSGVKSCVSVSQSVSPSHHSIVQRPIAADGGQSAHMEGCCKYTAHSHKELTRGGPLAWGLGKTLTTQHKNQQVTKCYT